jgi:hypothetical protein
MNTRGARYGGLLTGKWTSLVSLRALRSLVSEGWRITPIEPDHLTITNEVDIPELITPA